MVASFFSSDEVTMTRKIRRKIFEEIIVLFLFKACKYTIFLRYFQFLISKLAGKFDWNLSRKKLACINIEQFSLDHPNFHVHVKSLQDKESKVARYLRRDFREQFANGNLPPHYFESSEFKKRVFAMWAFVGVLFTIILLFLYDISLIIIWAFDLQHLVPLSWNICVVLCVLSCLIYIFFARKEYFKMKKFARQVQFGKTYLGKNL